MRKKDTILLMQQMQLINNNLEKLKELPKLIEAYNQNTIKINELNGELDKITDFLKVMPTVNDMKSFLALVNHNNTLKNETNKKVDDLIKEVVYANKRLED